MRRAALLAFLAAAGLMVCTPASQAGKRKCSRGGHAGCASEAGCAGEECGYVTESRTIMVPEMATETRTVTATEYRTEVQNRQVTRYRTVPVTEQVPYTYTVCESQVQT